MLKARNKHLSVNFVTKIPHYENGNNYILCKKRTNICSCENNVSTCTLLPGKRYTDIRFRADYNFNFLLIYITRLEFKREKKKRFDRYVTGSMYTLRILPVT